MSQKPPRRPILSLNKCRDSPSAATTPKLTRKPLRDSEEAKSLKACQSQLQSLETSVCQRSSDQAATDLSEWLAQHSSVWHEYLPLSVGVIEDVYELLAFHNMQDSWSKRVIHKTLRWHTSRTAYWETLLFCNDRYGLDGQKSGLVTPDQRERARRQLDERRKALKRKNGGNPDYTDRERK